MNKVFLIKILIIMLLNSNYLLTNESIVTHFNLTKQLILQKGGVDPFDYLIYFGNNKLYVTIKPPFVVKKGDDIIFHCIDDKREIEMKIKLPYEDWLVHFTVYNNSLFILGQYYVYHFENVFSKGKPILKHKYETDDMYEYIYFYNNRLVLAKSCFSCSQQHTKVFIIDLSLNKNFKHIFENPIGFPLTTFKPRKIISFYKNTFLVSDITQYKIKIFDGNFNLIQELIRSSSEWDKDSNKKFNNNLIKIKNFKDLQKYMNYFSQAESKYYTIVNADFINDKTILVCYSTSLKNPNGEFEYYYDIWKKDENGKWILFEKDLRNSKQNQNSKFNYNDLNGFWGQYFLFENRIIIASDLPFYINDLDLKNITFNDIYQKKIEYYKKNDIKVSYFIYEYKVSK